MFFSLSFFPNLFSYICVYVQVVAAHKGELSARERTLRVVRVTTDDGKVVAGVKFPHNLLPQLRANIEAFNKQKEDMNEYLKKAHAAGVITGKEMQYQIEQPSPVLPKCVKIASTPQPTMKSFFSVKPTSSSSLPSSTSLPAASSPPPVSSSTSSTVISSKRSLSLGGEAKSAKPKRRSIQSFFKSQAPPTVTPQAPSSSLPEQSDEDDVIVID